TITGPTNFVLPDGGMLTSSVIPLTLPNGVGLLGGGATSATINGDIVADTGSRIAPGNSTTIGSMQFNSQLTFNHGANWAVKLADTTGDRVDGFGGLNLAGTVNLQIGSLGAGPTVSSTYTIANYGSLTGNETNFNVIGNGSRMTFPVVPTATTPGTIQLSVGG